LLLVPRNERDDKQLKNNNPFGNDAEMDAKERIRLLLASYAAQDIGTNRNENDGVIRE
jgi:hypothetical protein